MSSFKDVLKKNQYEKQLKESTPFTTALDILQEVANDYGSVMTKHGIAVHLEQGWLVDMGQQYRFVLQLKNRDYNHALFRAYINGSGRVMFDFYDEQPTPCDGTDAQSVHATVADFLNRPTTMGTVQQLIELARHKAKKQS